MHEFIFSLIDFEKFNDNIIKENNISSSIGNKYKPIHGVSEIMHVNSHDIDLKRVVLLKNANYDIISFMSIQAFEKYRRKMPYLIFIDENGINYKWFEKIDYDTIKLPF